jgi:hypothetical protein
MSPARTALARGLVAGAAVSLVLAVVTLAFGGLSIAVGPIVVRSHGVVRPTLAAAVLMIIAASMGRDPVKDALTWWWSAIHRYALAGAAVASLAVVTMGIVWGSFVAGGSDSYCYLNQAELFARGMVRDVEPLSDDKSWPGSPWSFAPAGHVPSLGQRVYLVPICPAGYPLLLAAARVTGGRTAMFWVTPFLGGVTVLLVFVLGRRLAGPAAGLLAAVLVAASPTLLYQVMQPMNDVPAAAFWCAAFIAASSDWRHASATRNTLAAGLLTGLALTIRPNLVPLGAVTALMAAFIHRNRTIVQRVVTLALFAAATLPGLAIIMAIQNAIYGSPLRSGYGDLSALFSLANILPNLQRYPRWLIESHTPVIAAAALAPFVVKDPHARRCAVWMLAFVAITTACYLTYTVYDAWWYTRFLLPAIPLLLALFAAVVVTCLERLPAPLRAAIFVGVSVLMAVLYIQVAIDRDVFRLRDLERRFRTFGEYATTLPANTAFITSHHSGSLRFYTGRSTVAWPDIDPGRLDDAIAFLRRHGRRPYLVFEAWEEADFRARFAGDRLGALRWRPMAEVDKVKIYDPDDF